MPEKVQMLLDLYLNEKPKYDKEIIDYLLAAECVTWEINSGKLILTSDGVRVIGEILNFAGELI